MIPFTRYYFDGTAVLHLFDKIGPGGITPDEFEQALQRIRRADRLTILIDSPGGAIEHSAQMAAAIRRLPMERHALVVGCCYSAAVDILMACSGQRAVEGSTLMLHQCSALDPEVSEADAQNVSASYVDRLSTGWGGGARATRVMLKKWVDMGCWFSSGEMVKFGFVNSTIPATNEIPLRTTCDLTGRNRPTAGEPFIEYGDILETPAFDTHYKSIGRAAAKRMPFIELPPLPASLVGKAILCGADVAREREILSQTARHAPGDVCAEAEAKRKAIASGLLSMYGDHQKELVAKYARGAAECAVRQAAGG